MVVRDARWMRLALALLLGVAACRPAPPEVDPVETYGRPGTGDGEFTEPRAVAASAYGLLVVDRSGRLQRFDLDGRFRASVRLTPPETRRGFPIGVTWMPDGGFVVADTHRGRLTLHDPAGGLIGTVGEYGGRPGQFILPQRVALDAEGAFHVTEFALGPSNRVQVFAADGTFLRTFGGPEPERGALGRPMGIVLRDDGTTVVADQRAGLLVFEPDGALRGPLLDGAAHGITLAQGLTGDDRGRLYVADLGSQRIHRVGADGTYLGAFGGPGAEPGRFREPWDVAWHAGYLYVADGGNHRVQRIAADEVKWVTP